MKKTVLLIAATALALSAGSAMAQKKTLAVVVKGLDNPFFTVLGNGCAKWNEENPDSDLEQLRAVSGSAWPWTGNFESCIFKINE